MYNFIYDACLSLGVSQLCVSPVQLYGTCVCSQLWKAGIMTYHFFCHSLTQKPTLTPDINEKTSELSTE